MPDLIEWLLATLRLGDAPPTNGGGRVGRFRAALALLPDLALQEGVSTWLYERLKRRGELAELPASAAERLRTAVLRAATTNLRVDQETYAVLTRLEAAGIPVVPLKGVARRILAGHLYHQTRATADVDLLIAPAQAHAPTNHETRGFRLRDFLDLAVLIELGDPIDWEEIRARTLLGEAAEGHSHQPVPPQVLTAWLAAAGSLTTRGDLPAALAEPFDLAGLLRWRMRVLRTARCLRSGLVNRLRKESTRVALGLPPEPPPPWARPRRARWRAVGRASRAAFRLWRLLPGTAS